MVVDGELGVLRFEVRHLQGLAVFRGLDLPLAFPGPDVDKQHIVFDGTVVRALVVVAQHSLHGAVAAVVVADGIHIEHPELLGGSVVGGDEVPFDIVAPDREHLESGRRSVGPEREPAVGRRLPPAAAHARNVMLHDVAYVGVTRGIVGAVAKHILVRVPGYEMHVGEIFQQGGELIEQFARVGAFLLHTAVDRLAGEAALVAYNRRVECYYQRGVLVLHSGEVLDEPVHLLGGEVVVVVALAGDALIGVDPAFAVEVHDVVEHHVMLAAEVEGVVRGAHSPAVALGGVEVDVSLARDAAVVVVVAHHVEHRHRELALFQRLGEALDGISVLVPVTVIDAVAAVEAVHRSLCPGFFVFFQETGHKDLLELVHIVEEVGQVDVRYGEQGVVVVVDSGEGEIVALRGACRLRKPLPEMRHTVTVVHFRP